MIKCIILIENRLFCLILICTISAHALCPPITSTSNPWFQSEPPKVISKVDGRYTSLTCCVDGYTELRWYFRKMNNYGWHTKQMKRIQLEDGNRTLHILRPITNMDTGFYSCNASDLKGNNSSRSIFVYFLNVDQSKNIHQKDQSVSPDTKFTPGSNANISCYADTYERQALIYVTWNYLHIDDASIITRPHSINTVLTTADNRSGETNPDFVEVRSDLIIIDIKMADRGNYSCVMIQNGTKILQTFFIYVVDDRINWQLILILITITITAISVILLMKMYYYEIILFYKSYLDLFPNTDNRLRDVSILYEDMDDACAKISFDIIGYLEKYGFNCWLYDRNKEFGGDMAEDFIRSMKQSHVLLTFLSSDSKTLVRSLSSINPDPSVRRLYVFNPNRNHVFNTLINFDKNIVQWINNELKFQTLLQSHAVDFDIGNTDKVDYQQFSTWVMASMPSKAIREAKKRCSINKVEF